MPQCLGRLTVERKNTPEHQFIDSKSGFFLPKRCSTEAANGLDICAACEEKRKMIPERLKKWNGTMQNQSSQYHGKVTEPIPEWSRIYKGAYYSKMLKKGLTVDSDALAAAEEALAATIKGVTDIRVEMPKKVTVTAEAPMTEPVTAPQPSPKKRVVIKKKAAESPTTPSVLEALANSPAVEEPVTPVPIITPLKEKPKRRIQPKKTGSAATAPTAPPIAGIVKPGVKAEQPTVVKVKLRKTEIDGRTVYLQSEKDKVFDLKFQYLGRYDRRNDCIVSGYPDSDADQRG